MTTTANSFSFWTPGRIRRIAFVVLASLVIAHIIVFLKDVESTSSVRRGDFPAFYAAAKIITSGRKADLYNQHLQQEIENQYWPSLNDTYLSFAYPPFVAVFLSPLASFSPLIAKGVFSAFLLACLGLAVWKSREFIPFARRFPLPFFVLIATFGPVLSSIAAAQNTAISLALYATGITHLLRGTKKDDAIAGLVFGLWLFKPNFALIALFFLFLAGRFRAVAFASIPATIYYWLGATVLGVTWPKQWLQAAAEFSTRDLPTNQFQMVSIRGVVNATLTLLEPLQVSPLLVQSVGCCLWAVVFLLTVKQFVKTLPRLNISTGQVRMKQALLLLGPAMVLLSPHALYYDLGLCVIAAAGWLAVKNDRQATVLITFLFVSFVLTFLREKFLVGPMFVFPLVCFAFLYSSRNDRADTTA